MNFNFIEDNKEVKIKVGELKRLRDAMIEHISIKEALTSASKTLNISTKCTAKALELIERIKGRYPFIWGECTTEEDIEYIAILLEELNLQ